MLSVQLLGPVEVRIDDVLVDLGGPQQRAVIAHLALEPGHVVSVERLIDRLWGDEPPRTPLGTLQSYVSRLRRALEPRRAAGAPAEVLVSEAPGYLLRVDPTQVDVHRFRSLVDEARLAADAGDHAAALARLDVALGLWRGPALAGIGADDLVRPIVVRLEEERAAAFDERFEALLALGRHQEAIPQLQAAVDEQPMHERLWGLLALALYRSGRQADALRALSSAREVLLDELGLDPGPDLRELEQRILAQDPGLQLDGGAHRPAPASPPPVPVDVPRIALVGRPAEWSALQGALEAAVAAPGLVLLEGEPGIGKSTLCDAFLAQARAAGWHTVTGRCLEPGLAPTLWPCIEIARTLLAIDEAAGGAASRGDTGDGAPQANPWQRLAAGRQVATATVELADHFVDLLHAAVERPGTTGCVVLVDDLHWADQATLDVLQLVLSRLGRGGVLVVAAHRPPELVPDSLLAAALAGLHRSVAAATRVPMAPLDAPGVAELIAATTGVAPSAELAERVQARTSGNPLFVTELARLAGERGLDDASVVPDAVRDVVRSRLAALPVQAIAELEVAAVVGERFDVRTVMAASERDPDSCLDALDAAIVTRILVPEANGYRFAHALVRDAVLADLPALRSARLHRRVADAILAVQGDAADAAEPVAHHRYAARSFLDPLMVAQALVRASDVARWRNALDAAERWANLALDVLDGATRTSDAARAEVARVEVEVLEALLGMVVRRNDQARLEALVERVRARGESSDNDGVRALGLFLVWDDVDTVADLADPGLMAGLEEARRLVARTTDPYALLTCHYMIGAHAMLCGRLHEAAEHLDLALGGDRDRPAEVTPQHVPVVLLPVVAAITAAVRGDADEARRHGHVRIRAWLAQRAEVDESVQAALAFTSALVEALLGDPRHVVERLPAGARAGLHGFLDGQAPATDVLRAWALVMTGVGDDAGDRPPSDPGTASLVDAMLTSIAAFEAGGEHSLRGTLWTFVADALVALGDERAWDALDRATGEANGRGEYLWFAETLRVRALADRRLGDGSRVGALLDEAEARAVASGAGGILARVRATREGLAGQASR